MNQLTKDELVAQLSVKTALTKKQVRAVIDELPNVVKSNLDLVVVLPGIGRLKQTTRAARNGVNPATKEKILIPEKQTIKFAAAKELLDGLK